ncbi:MAG: Zn-ribbon domain-containing OB-fold protein [Nitrososphaerota archaeon]
MSVFEAELKKGRFVIGQCTKCQKTTWPPNDFCGFCFGDMSWRAIKEPGVLVEYSAMDGKIFAMAEFEESIRVMGLIANDVSLKPGQKIRVASCGFDIIPKFIFYAE